MQYDNSFMIFGNLSQDEGASSSHGRMSSLTKEGRRRSELVSAPGAAAVGGMTPIATLDVLSSVEVSVRAVHCFGKL